MDEEQYIVTQRKNSVRILKATVKNDNNILLSENHIYSDGSIFEYHVEIRSLKTFTNARLVDLSKSVFWHYLKEVNPIFTGPINENKKESTFLIKMLNNFYLWIENNIKIFYTNLQDYTVLIDNSEFKIPNILQDTDLEITSYLSAIDSNNCVYDYAVSRFFIYLDDTIISKQDYDEYVERHEKNVDPRSYAILTTAVKTKLTTIIL